MKEKVKNILDKYGLIDENYPVVINEIDTLYKVDFDKRVAFEVACNPDLLEVETNYKLYESEIKQLKKIIQAQDELYKIKISLGIK